jgi:hypothetical protein
VAVRFILVEFVLVVDGGLGLLGDAMEECP